MEQNMYIIMWTVICYSLEFLFYKVRWLFDYTKFIQAKKIKNLVCLEV